MNKESIGQCKCTIIHYDIVNSVKSKMLGNDKLYDLAELFKIFGDTTRVRILYSLFEAEMCVCDIAALLNMSHSSISHQLRILKQSRLVKNRKKGKSVYYSLMDGHIKDIFAQGLKHITE